MLLNASQNKTKIYNIIYGTILGRPWISYLHIFGCRKQLRHLFEHKRVEHTAQSKQNRKQANYHLNYLKQYLPQGSSHTEEIIINALQKKRKKKILEINFFDTGKWRITWLCCMVVARIHTYFHTTWYVQIDCGLRRNRIIARNLFGDDCSAVAVYSHVAKRPSLNQCLYI